MSVVEEGIINRLITATRTKKIIADRAFSGIIQPNDEADWLPAVSVELVNNRPEMHAGGETGISEANLVLTAWGRTQAQAKELSEAIRLDLNGYKGAQGPVYLRAIFLEDAEDIYFESADNAELRAHGVQLTANVWHVHQIAVPY